VFSICHDKRTLRATTDPFAGDALLRNMREILSLSRKEPGAGLKTAHSYLYTGKSINRWNCDKSVFHFGCLTRGAAITDLNEGNFVQRFIGKCDKLLKNTVQRKGWDHEPS